MFDREAYEKRVAWFTQARFGLFIHWGPYSALGRGEWVRSEEEMPRAVYDATLPAFDASAFAPTAWARAAKDAGIRYAVLTAKHHDGFCLFDSDLTDYKATNFGPGRDLVRAFLEAFRAEGIRVGLYYSLLDWQHPDYPHHGDGNHPLRNDPAQGNENRDFSRYLSYLHGQVEELCTRYGKIDLFWFDYSYDDLRGEAWRASQLVRMIRRYQPDALIDSRLEVSGEGFRASSLLREEPKPYSGDFLSPEQIIPPGEIRDEIGRTAVWESCATMNGHWGYCAEDRAFKPAALLVRKLVECVSKGGNFLLNVGPDAHGRIPAESLAILRDIGAWMHRNGESIYGCGSAGLPRPEYGRLTKRGNRLYYHFLEAPLGPAPLPGVRPADLARIRLLGDGADLAPDRGWIAANYPDTVHVRLGDGVSLPDAADTVVEVTLRDA